MTRRHAGEHRPTWRCLCAGLAVAVSLLTTAPAVLAGPAIIATLKLAGKATTMSGELRFDLGGGKMQGKANIDAPLDSQSQLKTVSGGTVGGRVKIAIEFDGAYSGGLYGSAEGSAKVSGTFTDDKNCAATVSGPGSFLGSVSAPLGMVEVRLFSMRIELNGCNLASPQRLGMVLPPFTFAKTDIPPTIVVPPATFMPATATAPPGSRSPAIAGSAAIPPTARASAVTASPAVLRTPTSPATPAGGAGRSVSLSPDMPLLSALCGLSICGSFIAVLAGVVVVLRRLRR